METHLVIAEITISRGQYNSKLYKLFHASYRLFHSDLFLHLNNFLFHLFFQYKFLAHVFFFRHYYIFWYFSILLIKPIISNIRIGSCFLNTFSSSFLESLQIIERTKFFSKRYEIFYLKKRKKYFFHPFNYWKYFTFILSFFL